MSLVSLTSLTRLVRIEHVFVKYGLEQLLLEQSRYRWLRHVFLLSPTRWLNSENRTLARGQRIRLALEELGPVFVKLGQMLSTRRDLLPDDIGDELALLQDRVSPISTATARREIEAAMGQSIVEVFDSFEDTPLASASVAQVHGARLPCGADVVVKVLRPDIKKIIDRDVGLMYRLSDLVELFWLDGKRMRAREVVQEYDRTIHDELDLLRESANAVTLKENHRDIDMLYVPQIYWEHTRSSVLVMERIEGIPIRNVEEMKNLGMNMKKLAENGVEIFYTQVFRHNFFHADMHPGNIFVSRDHLENPQYIAVDFGIVGSLTEQDQHYLGENLLAFFQRDYRRVAQLHVDSGWVPADTRVADFESSIRTVCEPIFEKPLAEISFGVVLLQLFQTARRFNMEVQPQLVLLQKTLLNIEGLGRQLYPELDLWATGKPFLQRWVMERRGPAALMRRFFEQAPLIIDKMPEMPMMMHALIDAQTQAARAGAPTAMALGTAHAARQMDPGRQHSKALRYTLTGCTLVLVASLLSVAAHLGADGQTPFPWYSLLIALLGAVFLLRGLKG